MKVNNRSRKTLPLSEQPPSRHEETPEQNAPLSATPDSTGAYAERNGYFQAKIVVDGTALRLGDWPSEKEAAAAYDSAARYYRGKSKGRNGTEAPPRSQEELQRRASEARASERGDTSVYRGVVDKPEKPGWTAQIGIGGWPYFLGRFPEEEQAARAADMAIRQYRPSDPTNFEGEEARAVAEIRRWARRLHSEEGLGEVQRESPFRGVWWSTRKERWKKREVDRGDYRGR